MSMSLRRRYGCATAVKRRLTEKKKTHKHYKANKNIDINTRTQWHAEQFLTFFPGRRQAKTT